MTLKTNNFDVSKYLDTPEDIRDYLAIALEDGDELALQLALGDIARAKGMSKIAAETGLNRESLYKSLSAKGNPSFATISKVAAALGLKLTFQPVQA
ncbi:MAG: addiction module antidote protein [Mobiluncus porci]|uniref:Putative addiction module antidote protein n=1 Tax=Mobiluncus porci TaxID=2652278 RepID=A0A7K0K4F0_9ACTO|nr:MULTISPECIES: addiction module antidote protein [Mobiluncus]MCI6584361.1 putative addiction module antidote protein [Mobiluncus sp.]MDD7541781.1 putative addiction module antidote protein [Mobiluncus porci]MDY5748629.1 addiction module antidote protein [Mobiluncus porci]MST50363.1 putative addiction module antidote protein [Mobiluncus porci]